MVIIFAVMFTGGTSSLLSGDVASSVTNTPTPSDGESNPSASPSASPGPSWKVNISGSECKFTQEQTPYLSTNLEATGTSNGYLSLEVIKDGKTEIVTTFEFNSPSEKGSLSLHKAQGFSDNPWKLKLFEGGSQVAGQWEGGTEKASYNDGKPTGC